MVGLLVQVDRTLRDWWRKVRARGARKLDSPLNMSVPADGDVKQFQPKRLDSIDGALARLEHGDHRQGDDRDSQIAILAADGVDDAALLAMKKALMAAGAHAKVVAPRLGVLKGAKGAQVKVDFSFLTAGSVLFDAIYLPGGEPSVEILKGDVEALLFVKEAYLHCKTIAATDAGIELLSAAQLGSDKTAKSHAQGVQKDESRLMGPDEGVVMGRGAQTSQVAAAFIQAIAQHRHWDREGKGQVTA